MVKNELLAWFDRVNSGQVHEEVKDEKFHMMEIKDFDIYNWYLLNTTFTDKSNFTDFVLEEGYDSVAVFYTSEIKNDD